MSVYAHMEAITKSVCFDVGWRYVRMPFYVFIGLYLCVSVYVRFTVCSNVSPVSPSACIPVRFSDHKIVCVCVSISLKRARTHTLGHEH